MFIIRLISMLFGLTILASVIPAHAQREICITIDDLPFVGSASTPGERQRKQDRFYKIVQALAEEQVPAIGFVIAGSISKGQWQLLEDFKNQGFMLGNHTYNHSNLNHVGTEKYIEDIAKADHILTPLMSGKKYFRYPYLAEGHGDNRHKIRAYLSDNQYTIAPVTIDSKDFRFNERFLSISSRIRNQYLSAIKQQYLAYIWNQTLKAEQRTKHSSGKQILLIHANLLNSLLLGDVIRLYKEHGYRFISLDEALTPTQEAVDTTKHQLPPVEAVNQRFARFVNQFASLKRITDNVLETHAFSVF